MLRLLIADIEPHRQNIRCEQDLSNPKTIITVQSARQRYQGADFTLAVGSDLIDQLPNWYHVQALLNQTSLLIFPRPGYPIHSSQIARLRDIGAQVELADITGLPVSSSAYRQDGDTRAITPHVEAYIHQEHLYTCHDIPLT